MSGRAVSISSCQNCVARTPQLGQNRDLHLWHEIFVSVEDAYTSAPKTGVPQLITFTKFIRTWTGVPSWSQYVRVSSRRSLNGCLNICIYSFLCSEFGKQFLCDVYPLSRLIDGPDAHPARSRNVGKQLQNQISFSWG